MKNEVKRISQEQFIALINGSSDVTINGNTFINIETMTAVSDLIKPKSNPFNGAMKMNISNVQIFQNKNGSSYEAKVKRELSKEGKDAEAFKLQPRVWGERIKNTPLVTHKGEFYLEVMFHNKVGKTKYLHEGKEISPKTIKPHRRAKKEGSQGGLSDENKVTIRSYKVASIQSITIAKQKYVIM
mgnify:CR=1 FL=1